MSTTSLKRLSILLIILLIVTVTGQSLVVDKIVRDKEDSEYNNYTINFMKFNSILILIILCSFLLYYLFKFNYLRNLS